MSNESIRLLKQCARVELRSRLTALTALQRDVASKAIVGHLINADLWSRARCVLLYAAFADEPSLAPLAADALARGVVAALPRVEADGRMSFRRVESLDERSWSVDACGVRAPNGEELLIGAFDFIAVPGVGFAADGMRLGRGKGYYDRLLASLPTETTTVGIAFACQIRNRLPIESHDARVRWIATEDGVFKSVLS